MIDEHGRQVKTTGAASDPQAIATALRRHAKEMVRIVLESGQLSTWLTRKLRALGLPVVCVDARQAHRALSGRLNKSDPADAEGLAQLARTGWFREVHIKSLTSDRLRALLSARDRLIRIRTDSPDPIIEPQAPLLAHRRPGRPAARRRRARLGIHGLINRAAAIYTSAANARRSRSTPRCPVFVSCGSWSGAQPQERAVRRLRSGRRPLGRPSLIETCKLNAVDPQAYLAATLTRFINRHPASQIDQLMPWAYADQVL